MLITITEQATSIGLTQIQFQGIYKLCHFYSLAVSYRIDEY